MGPGTFIELYIVLKHLACFPSLIFLNESPPLMDYGGLNIL